jgi:hypothetical protein
MESQVYVNIGPIQNLRRALESGDGHVAQAYKDWAFIVRVFEHSHFIKSSRGGGDWPPLKPGTIAGRRHGKGGNFKRGSKALAAARASGGGQVSILWDVGTLITALDPVFQGAPGAIEEPEANGITIGFGGPSMHPDSNVTIADIAMFHDQGMGRNPVRKILIEPDGNTIARMREVMLTALEKSTGNT